MQGSPAPGSSWKLELKDSSLLVSLARAKCICKQAFSVAPYSCSPGVKKGEKRARNRAAPSLQVRTEPGRAWPERLSLGTARPALLALCPEP